MRIPIAKDGFPYIFASIFIAAIFLIQGWVLPGIFLILAIIFLIIFFRDPERQVPDDKSIIVSPADGKVIGVDTPETGSGNGKAYRRISIFMSLLNVHVNRAPVTGKITQVTYTKGKFFPAFKETSSLFNEQNTLVISHPSGFIKVTQIAGIIARRIVCTKNEGDTVRRGERIGLIKFGSRVDLYLPPGIEILIKEGDDVKGGVTAIGRIQNVS
ncbi:MAG: phosphatidylserine decarboxylase [Candidatus Schekmanbacteria bacterium RBG_13_48_7]|uniref:Phosphatidylserine decarboxylase proenzyme n=1 Tax=Candidatus Schekmanbacteria bacterium RBG_13_48_7 TaxID=1817878 RepID=A0A1F7S4S8_9BACT|nr:MAG: phosphatidylserine decarboxylase [Candidatus Schekmanbacteria bacterium RBG_13_48_7]